MVGRRLPWPAVVVIVVTSFVSAGCAQDKFCHLIGATSSGHVVFSGAAVVAPHAFQPNGAGCEPTAWVASLDASGHDRLTVDLNP